MGPFSPQSRVFDLPWAMSALADWDNSGLKNAYVDTLNPWG